MTCELFATGVVNGGRYVCSAFTQRPVCVLHHRSTDRKRGAMRARKRETTKCTAAPVLGYCTFDVELFASSHGL